MNDHSRLLPIFALIALLGAAPARGQPVAQPGAQPVAAPSLAEAVAAIRSRRKIDLTHPLDEATPMPPGFAPPRLAPAVDPRTLEPLTIARDGERATYYGFAGPAGTHVEAAAAVSADGVALDAIPPDEMLLPLVVIDATALAAADPVRSVSPADLAAHEARHGRVPPGAFVALRTGRSKAWGTPAFAQRPVPGWSPAVLRLLFEERGAVAVGQESLETGMRADMGTNMGTDTDRAAAAALGRGHWMLAGLDHLDALPATGAAILVSWPRVAGGFAFPARAIAILP